MALAHYNAAFSSEAAGHRHILVSLNNFVSMKTFADILHEEFSPKGFKIPIEENSGANDGKHSMVNNNRMKTVLGITEPIPLKKTVIDMANSLIENGLAKLKIN